MEDLWRSSPKKSDQLSIWGDGGASSGLVCMRSVKSNDGTCKMKEEE